MIEPIWVDELVILEFAPFNVSCSIIFCVNFGEQVYTKFNLVLNEAPQVSGEIDPLKLIDCWT